MSPESLAVPLRNLAPVFEGCVLWAVRAILETDARVKAPFEILSGVPEGSSLYCILPAANLNYYAQLVIGMEECDLPHLLPNESDEKVRKDAMGEIANVISGLFIADDQFISRFGYLKPSTPFFSEGAFTARKDWGLRGRIESNGKELELQFYLRDLKDPAALALDQSDSAAMDRKGSPA
jgi:hypothetical protein